VAAASLVAQMLLVYMTEHPEERVELVVETVRLIRIGGPDLFASQSLQLARQLQGQLDAGKIEPALLDQVFHLP
jgi:hypothetical protein